MSKKTPLYAVHEALGAKIIPFAGYDMPVRYSGDKEEHMAVRENAGMFDISHMGEFIVRGPKALEFIQKVTSNDASKLYPGKAQYTCFPNADGGIIDDLIVYHIRGDEYMLVVNAGNLEKDWEWVQEHNTMGADLINISEESALIAVSGPKAEAVVQKLTKTDLSGMKTYECFKETFNGAEKSLIATTGYTGERTFEVFVYNKYAEQTWNDLLDAGQEFGLIPTGLGARDTLRLEMGYMLYGNDINDSTSPIEAGLSWITKLNKGPFIGSDKIQQVKDEGAKRKLVGFKMTERGIPRTGYQLADGDKVLGEVTSGTMSPMLGEGIGMGYVPTEYAKAGTEIDVIIRNKSVKAEVVRPPFVKK